MYNGKKILGLIPARGGSKRLPGKNIKPLLGKPLIAWTIEQALASTSLDRIVVSTDSAQIAAVAQQYPGVSVMMRPPALAADEATVMDTVAHTLDALMAKGEAFDLLGLMEPTSPLRANGDIDNAIALLADHADKAESVVSFGKVVLEHPLMAKRVGEDGLIRPFIETDVKFARMQDIPQEAFIPYGVIYLSKVESLKSARTFYPARTMPYYLQRWQNYEVDDKFDFLAIEAIWKEHLNSEGLCHER